MCQPSIRRTSEVRQEGQPRGCPELSAPICSTYFHLNQFCELDTSEVSTTRQIFPPHRAQCPSRTRSPFLSTPVYPLILTAVRQVEHQTASRIFSRRSLRIVLQSNSASVVKEFIHKSPCVSNVRDEVRRQALPPSVCWHHSP